MRERGSVRSAGVLNLQAVDVIQAEVTTVNVAGPRSLRAARGSSFERDKARGVIVSEDEVVLTCTDCLVNVEVVIAYVEPGKTCYVPVGRRRERRVEVCGVMREVCVACAIASINSERDGLGTLIHIHGMGGSGLKPYVLRGSNLGIGGCCAEPNEVCVRAVVY